jgi:hypothetical protein
MPRFANMGAIPNENIPQWQYDLLLAMKENIEILMGTRGPGRANTNDSIGVAPQEWQVMKQISARAEGTTNAAVGVPTFADYVRALNDLQQLAADVAKISQGLNVLLENLRRE